MAISTAVDASAVARVLGIKTTFKDLRGGAVAYLPQRVVVMAQGNANVTYSTDKKALEGALDAADTYGYGSQMHLSVKELLPRNGDGVGTIPVTAYPLAEPGGGVVATETITPTGTATGSGTFFVYVNEKPSASFVISKDEAPAVYAPRIATAINAILDLPITAAEAAAVVTTTSKWAGASANAITVEVRGPTTIGVTWGYVHNDDGAGLPDLSAALAQVGEVWESMFLNTNPYDDEVAMDDLQVFGVGRWTPLTRKPVIAFTGTTIASRATLAAITDTRRDDIVNAYLTNPGSNELPFVSAARQLARIVKLANNNPPHDYGSQAATGIEPGLDSVQWDGTVRELAVQAGISTVQIKDGVVNLSDIVTFHHPSGDILPSHRFVVDIVKLQQVIFNLALIFANPEWDGAPLVADDEQVENPSAKKPKTAKGAIGTLFDNLVAEAILTDADFMKENLQVAISSSNPKRLDGAMIVKVVGNTNIISLDLNWGFFFG